jgi:hypothetical protein
MDSRGAVQRLGGLRALSFAVAFVSAFALGLAGPAARAQGTDKDAEKDAEKGTVDGTVGAAAEGAAKDAADNAPEGAAEPSAEGAPFPAAVVIDRMVLVIGDRIITESEIRLEGALRARIPWWGPPRPPGADLQQVVADVALVRIFAGDTSLYSPSDEAVRARAEQLREAWGDPEAWQALLSENGLDEARLLALIRGRLIVERYIQRNLSLAARSEGRTVDELYVEWIPAQRGRAPVRVPSAVP